MNMNKQTTLHVCDSMSSARDFISPDLFQSASL